MESAERFGFFIQQYQGHIIRLSDLLYGNRFYINDHAYDDLFAHIMAGLTSLLSYLEMGYPRFFDDEENVPSSCLHNAARVLEKEMRAIRKKLPEKCGNKELAAIAFYPVDSFVNRKNNSKASYQRLRYVQELSGSLRSYCNAPGNDTEGKELEQILIFMNFNSLLFLKYMKDQISSLLNTLDLPAEKINWLREFRNEMAHSSSRGDITYKRQRAGITELISSWVSEEIAVIENREHGFSIAPPESHSGSAKEDDVLQLSLSVDSLGLLIRAAKDASIIVNKNQTTMLQTAAKIFRTRHAEQISPESLRNKFYTIERRSKEQVKNLLHELLRQVSKYCLVPLVICHDYFNGFMELPVVDVF